MSKLGVYTFDEDEWTKDPEERTWYRMGVFDFDAQEWVSLEHPGVDVNLEPPVEREEFIEQVVTGTIKVFEPGAVPGPVVSFEEEWDGM